jgi:ferredoxin-NADP reductase
MTTETSSAAPPCLRTRCSVPIDPTTVRFSVRDPNGTVTTYLYGTDVQIVKSSTGNYYVDVNGNSDGYWVYRFYSSGTGQAAAESGFYVTSNFV